MTIITITVEDDGEIQSVTLPSKKKTKVEPKAPAKKEQPSAFSPEFIRFIGSGDISEIKADPDHKAKYKHYLFAQLYDLKGRTLYAAKAAGINKRYIGILPAAIWDDEFVAELGKNLATNELTVVILDNGTVPSAILDMFFLDKDWSERGRLFNSLYRKPRHDD